MMEASATVGELVAERPSRSRVFEAAGIDYCCGGQVALAEACARRGLAVEEMMNRLTAESAAGESAERDWRTASLTELADHIEATHHAYLKAELPRLSAMAAKVTRAHGVNHPWVIELANVLDGLVAELAQHLLKEERVLFPYCRMLDLDPAAPAPLGTVANPIAMMEQEHDQAAVALSRLRALSRDYAPPADACNTFRAMLGGLAELEYDLHRHIHKENSILFPRAVAREAEGRG